MRKLSNEKNIKFLLFKISNWRSNHSSSSAAAGIFQENLFMKKIESSLFDLEIHLELNGQSTCL